VPTTKTFSPTTATISLSALAHNLAQLRRCLSPGCDLLAVVKANAYGHGAVEVTRTLIQQGVSRVAVVSVDEGLALRQAGVNAPIIVLGPLFPELIPAMIAQQLTPVVSDAGVLPALADAAQDANLSYPVHVKVETGMGRLGLPPGEVPSLIESPYFKGPLQLEGLMTHLADTDGPSTEFTEQQLRIFRQVLRQLDQAGLTVPLIHAANSAAIVRYPHAHFSLVRPGIMLYGYHTLPDAVVAPTLKPVLTLTTTIAQVRVLPRGESVSYNCSFTAARPSRIAVLPIGYADGYPRRLSNRGTVLVQGRRVPIVGLICMDMMMVDITGVPHANVGEEVVLIGRQGDEAITADELAEQAGTIPYEILCGIGPRVPRIYQSA
jgi:alanine racemase